MCKHAVRLEHLRLLWVGRGGGEGQHVVRASAQLFYGMIQPLVFGFRIVRYRVGNNHARLVKQDNALRDSFMSDCSVECDRPRVRSGQRLALAGERPGFLHFGEHHRDDLQIRDLMFRVGALLLGLHDQNAQCFACPLQRHAEE